MPDETQVAIPPITFHADGPNEEVRQANLKAILPSPGYPDAAILIADAITKRVSHVLLDYTSDAVSIRYQIDGFWHPMPPRDRQSGDYMLATLKKLCNLNYQERRARQEGEFGAEFQHKTVTCHFTSQGVQSGERVAIQLVVGKKKYSGLEMLNIRPKLADDLREKLKLDSGLIIVSTLPGDGSTTTWQAVHNAADRFMRDFYTIESAANPEPEVINVESVPYDRAAGQSPSTVLPQLLLRQPDVLSFSEPVSDDMVDTLSNLVLDDNQLVFARVNARSAVEALLRLLVLKPDVDRLSQALQAVFYTRLFRKLCEQCRQPYEPSPQLLLKLGIAAGRVRNFYRELQPPPPEQMVDEQGNPIPYVPCPECLGIGYRERSSICELLTINDSLRKVLREKPDLQTIAQAAQQNGHVSLKEEGVVQVAKGLTSITELQRVLKK